jgi:hypothetical protein
MALCFVFVFSFFCKSTRSMVRDRKGEHHAIDSDLNKIVNGIRAATRRVLMHWSIEVCTARERELRKGL